MRKSYLLLLVFFLSGDLLLQAQQALWNAPAVLSPEVRADNTVTFRLLAPNAKEVKISGEWMAAQGWIPGTELMKRMKYTYRESEGGHTWTNWRVYLSEFVPLLFK